MLQAVNTYTNEKQKEEEVKQEQLMQQDVDAEKIYFTILCIFLILNFFLLLIIVIIKLREQLWSVSSRTRERIIEDYNRDRELREIMARANTEV